MADSFLLKTPERGGILLQINAVADREKKPLPGALLAFLFALLLAAVIFVPLMIWGYGCFQYMGDYNVQQIAFYKHVHEAIRSGNLFWDWYTDLGANFIGSYSFYNLFSPFFWLTLPFPTAWVPYLMGPLLILKTASAALTSYLYLRRFVTSRDWAVFGALLYAFSGFMLFNVFFNHFHEPCVFFPLLLLALEMLVAENRRGFFALMVAVNAIVNYWFFIGEVVFVMLYVLLRLLTGGWGCTARKFLRIAFESVLGLLIAGAAFAPSALAVMGNPRTGWDQLITGQFMWIWGWRQRLPSIIQSYFFPPELPSNPVFFPEMGAKWASLSAWLPLFSATGTIAYCRAVRRDFPKRMILLSLILSLLPVGNALFVLGNDSYYARWFYMPLLLCAGATANALQHRAEPAFADGWKCGIGWTAGFLIVFILAVGFSPVRGDEGITFGLYSDEARFWFISASALICLALTVLLLVGMPHSKAFFRLTCISFAVVTAGYSIAYIGSGKHDRDYDRWYLEDVVGGASRVSVETEEPFARCDLYECTDNLGMQWGLPNIQCFHSIVPPSIMKMYPALGIKRDVSSKPGAEFRALRDLFSVRWLFIKADQEEQEPMRDFTYFDTENGYHIYENDNWLPMGFAFDTAITEENTNGSLQSERMQRCLLSVLVLSDEAIERNRDILTVLDRLENDFVSQKGYAAALKRRRAMAVDSFAIDRRGFAATCDYDDDTLVFFSVPYDAGWRAEINGIDTRIETADFGLMAVRVPAGEATIRFTYLAPGLPEGALLTVAGLALFALYLLVAAIFDRRRRAGIPARADIAAALDRLPPLTELPSDSNEEESP